ncbi:molybdopterin cofactor-binding domain-containing protein [Kordiimonas sp.]|uniref:xanthine dehydrogenase family protein molybdopterin-binding subunit n=1 Tax=Kordiimonas sp. TaxID=1970157 RepID=UPI003A90F321
MTFNLNRRDLFRYTAALGGLVVAGGAIGAGRAQAETGEGAITPMVHIAPDGAIKILYPNSEMGQGVDTSIPMMFAEEMDADYDRVTVAAMPLMLTRDAEGRMAWKVVPQGAGGSTSVTDAWTSVRRLGATTRALFLEAAAKRWGVAADSLKTEPSVVVNPADGARLSYGELAGEADKVTLPEGFEPTLKSRAEWRIIGRSRKPAAHRNIVTGKAVFGLDATYPGAKVAVIARSPYLDGFVEELEDSAARAVPGVVDIIAMPRPDLDKNYTYLAAGVAVIADSFWAAKKGRDALKITWNKGPYASESTESFDAHCDTLLAGTGQVVRDDGNVDSAKAADGVRVFSRRYRQPFVSHAQLEVQNAIAHVESDKATVIGPFQSPAGASRAANALTGLDRLSIKVEITRLGGGFGRRLTSDHAAEAVYLSKESGLPIKVVWTREDDLSHDFYRPAGHHELVAGFDASGQMVSWQHRLASASKYYRRDNVTPEQMFAAEMYVDDFPAGLVPNLRHEYFSATSGMPRGSWRAPAHVANAFAIQSFLNEVADELGEDPLALRLRLLGEGRELPYGQHGGPVFDTGRLRGVLEAAAKLASWGKEMPEGHAQGIAGHFTFGGYCAQVAEIERFPDGSFKVHRVYAAIDVGTVINPAGVIKQVEGGINDGLSAAFGQEIRVEGGSVLTQNFDTYPLLRMVDAPAEVFTTIIDNDKNPSGMGEMSIPVIAPAVTAALARAGGPLIRHLPVYAKVNEGVVKARTA